MSIFKQRRKIGPILLGAWLIATGANSLIGPSIPYAGPVLAGLAIAAGVLILMDR